MALRKENHGEGEETSKRNHKTSLKTEKPSNSSKEKNPDQKCQGALEICTHRKHALQGSPGVTRQCSKTGHWVQACKSSQPGKLFEVVEEEESFLSGEIVDVSEVQSNSTKSLWTATILVETS